MAIRRWWTEQTFVVNRLQSRTVNEDGTIESLRLDAMYIGDEELVATCDRALAGDPDAVAACLLILDPASALDD